MSGIKTTGFQPSSSDYPELHSLVLAFDVLPEAERYVIGLSGGLDSISLLQVAALVLKPKGKTLVAVHVDHGLSPVSADWARHCVQVCEQLDIVCKTEKVSVRSRGEGLEAAARKQRYHVFEQYLEEGDVLLLAHHEDDQLETILMRMMQGKHVSTWSGIPRQRALGKGLLFRPWLSISRVQLEAAANAQRWAWVEDESNRDLSFTRNRFRHQVIPQLQGEAPQMRDFCLALGSNVSRLNGLSERLTKSILDVTGRSRTKIELNLLNQMSEHARAFMLRAWLAECGVEQIPAAIFARVEAELLESKKEAMPLVQWGQNQLRRYGQTLYLLNVEGQEAIAFTEFELKRADLPLSVDVGGGRLSLSLQDSNKATAGATLLQLPMVSTSFTIGPRQEGDKITLQESGRAVSLKHVFSEAGIPPWAREYWPILRLDGELIAVAGLALAKEYTVQTESHLGEMRAEAVLALRFEHPYLASTALCR